MRRSGKAKMEWRGKWEVAGGYSCTIRMLVVACCCEMVYRLTTLNFGTEGHELAKKSENLLYFGGYTLKETRQV